MKAKLLITNLNSKEGEFEKIVPPELEILTIGRHPSSYVYLTSAHVSKEHALIIREYDNFFLVDKSSNGTLLNQARMEREKRNPLKSGDVITVGEYRIVFAIDQEKSRIQAPAVSMGRSDAGLPEAIAQPAPAPPVAKPAARPSMPPPRPVDAFKDPLGDSLGDPLDEPASTLASFSATSFEDVIRGLEPGDEASYLVFVGGARDGQRIELRGSTSEIYVGRANNCQVQIQHPSIGQMHAKIRMDWAGITVYDLNSQAGVFINGMRINSSRKLHNGDEISFGVPVSVGGVKLILYDRNSLSGENWIGLPPPVKVENNEKGEEKAEEKPAENKPEAGAPAAKSVTPEANAAAASAGKDSAPAKADAPAEAEEETALDKGVLDLDRVLYNGLTVRDALYIVGLIIIAAIFIVVALSFI